MNSLSFLLCLAVSLVLAEPEIKPSGLAEEYFLDFFENYTVASNIFNSTLESNEILVVIAII